MIYSFKKPPVRIEDVFVFWRQQVHPGGFPPFVCTDIGDIGERGITRAGQEWVLFADLDYKPNIDAIW